jgi:hypothetical protein
LIDIVLGSRKREAVMMMVVGGDSKLLLVVQMLLILFLNFFEVIENLGNLFLIGRHALI